VRERLVADAVADWKRQLIDLGGRNNLLYFRPLQVGTLELPLDDWPQVERLLRGQQLGLSAFFPDAARQADAAKRARALHRKATENDEERGIKTLFLALGFCRWPVTQAGTNAVPNAPLLLYPATLVPAAASHATYRLEVEPEPEVNPTLLYLLERDFGLRPPETDEFIYSDAGICDPRDIITRLTAQLRRAVPRLEVEEKAVLANFSYAKLPMVRDLDAAGPGLAGHTLLSAIAGDPSARDELRAWQSGCASSQGPVVPPPGDEYLVLDADSSQSAVIAAAVSGANLVVEGPPGTGKSQTIANLIATLTARGKSVLFVAEKRAAIDAVIHRLTKEDIDLGGLILDLHDGAGNRRKVAAELQRALNTAGNAVAPDVAALHARLVNTRESLDAYAEDLHTPIDPWGRSPFELQAEIGAIPAPSRIAPRIRGAALERLAPQILRECEEHVRRFVALGGCELIRGSSPWAESYRADALTSATEVSAALETLHDLGHGALPRLAAALERSCAQTGLVLPATLTSARELLDLADQVARILGWFDHGVFRLDLPGLIGRLAPAGEGLLKRIPAAVFSGRYRAARRTAREASREQGVSDADLLARLEAAQQALLGWQHWSTYGSPPSAVGERDTLRALLDETTAALSGLSVALRQELAQGEDIAALQGRLAWLESAQTAALRMPELHAIESRLHARGLSPVLAAICEARLDAEEAVDALDYAWSASIRERVLPERRALANFDLLAHQKTVDDFESSDRAHIRGGPPPRAARLGRADGKRP
jgi:hypothetical protein